MEYRTPYETQASRREDVDKIMGIMFLTMFFAYLGYQLLIMNIRKNDGLEARFQIVEQHIEALEQNTTSLTDQSTDLAESIFALQAKIDSVLEESGTQQKDIQVLSKYLLKAFDNRPLVASQFTTELKEFHSESTPTAS